MAPFPNPLKVGQRVRRRLGALGGTGKAGTVREIVMRGVHECLTVDFGDRTETFIWSTYEPADNRLYGEHTNLIGGMAL